MGLRNQNISGSAAIRKGNQYRNLEIVKGAVKALNAHTFADTLATQKVFHQNVEVGIVCFRMPNIPGTLLASRPPQVGTAVLDSHSSCLVHPNFTLESFYS